MNFPESQKTKRKQARYHWPPETVRALRLLKRATKIKNETRLIAGILNAAALTLGLNVKEPARWKCKKRMD